MKILLAGGEGYIGSHLYSQLEEIASVTSIDYSNSAIKKDFISMHPPEATPRCCI